MQIKLLMIGNTENNFIADGIDIYSKRLKHYVKFSQKVLNVPKNYKNLQKNELIKREAELLLRNIDSSATTILLDEKGEEYTSPGFAKWLQKTMNKGADINFIIGGSYGFTDELRNKFYKISLSKMTFSHQMVRLFFIEQLYRAFTIIKGENYHH